MTKETKKPKDTKPKKPAKPEKPSKPPREEKKPVTKRREDEMAIGASQCARLGHLFFVSRDFCGRCFCPKPRGWSP